MWVHVLGSGDTFDFATRRPTAVPSLKEASALEAKALGTP